MYKTTEIATLIKKQMDGTITSAERLQLQVWADESPTHKDFLNKVFQGDLIWEDALKWMELENSDTERWETKLERRTLSKIGSKAPYLGPKSGRILRRVFPYAAAILLFSIASILYIFDKKKSSLDVPEIVHNINPGGNRAQLTLSDGRVVELNSEKDGIIIGDKLTYSDGTIISSDQHANLSVETLTTPKGGRYHVTLQDGTKVWLNSASKLTYPVRFSEEQRVVELEGEAFFEVAKRYRKDKSGRRLPEKLPFLVKTSNQVIEVLGTQFNVMAYADELSTKTTLTEGSVLLKSNQGSLMLIPGEQGILLSSELTKVNVDINQQIAWKNNKFAFYETELQSAMKELSRWYNIEIIYEGKIPTTHFYGEISREKGLADVLKILEVGGVRFRMEKVGDANRLIVFP